MTAKEELQSIGRMRNKLKRMRNRIGELREAMTSLSSPSGSMNPDKVQTSMNGDKMAALMADLDDLEKSYLDGVEGLQHSITEIAGKIERLPNERQKEVLYKRYVLGQTWEQIAVDMNFYIRHVYRIHGEALKEYYGIE